MSAGNSFQRLCPLKTAAVVLGAMLHGNPRPNPSWGPICDAENCAWWSDFDDGCCFGSLAGSAVDALQSIASSLCGLGGGDYVSDRAGGLASAVAAMMEREEEEDERSGCP